MCLRSYLPVCASETFGNGWSNHRPRSSQKKMAEQQEDWWVFDFEGDEELLGSLEADIDPLLEPTEEEPVSKKVRMSEPEQHDEESSKKENLFGEDEAWKRLVEEYEREAKRLRKRMELCKELLFKS